MKKYYFPHDYHAHNDTKIMTLLAKHMLEGYGLYWILIELMHDIGNGKLNTKDLKGVMYRFQIEEDFFNDVITTCIEIELFKKENEFLFSNRCLKNKDELDEYFQQKSNAGKKGMASRWKHNDVITKNNAVITNHNKQNNIKQNKIKININCTIKDFNLFWSLYPNKVDKKKARDKFIKIESKVLPALMAGLNQQVLSTAWTKDEGKFIPHPTTWLNGERWEDEVLGGEGEDLNLATRKKYGLTN